jgi:hypothetical protein
MDDTKKTNRIPISGEITLTERLCKLVLKMPDGAPYQYHVIPFVPGRGVTIDASTIDRLAGKEVTSQEVREAFEAYMDVLAKSPDDMHKRQAAWNRLSELSKAYKRHEQSWAREAETDRQARRVELGNRMRGGYFSGRTHVEADGTCFLILETPKAWAGKAVPIDFETLESLVGKGSR